MVPVGVAVPPPRPGAHHQGALDRPLPGLLAHLLGAGDRRGAGPLPRSAVGRARVVDVVSAAGVARVVTAGGAGAAGTIGAPTAAGASVAAAPAAGAAVDAPR